MTGETVRGSGHSDAGAGTAFDAFHPPSADQLADCIHCGFCLPTCPTYVLWGEEMDSPRGRIQLMQFGLDGTVAMGTTLVGHMDACLGCMACVTACPSGVRYDELIEATRAQIERNHRRRPADRLFRRLVFALFCHPGRLRVAAALAWLYQRSGTQRALRRSGALRRLPARVQALDSLLPAVRLGTALPGRLPERTPARGERRRRVGLVTGCVQAVFFADVNAATIRVLAAEGCDVITPGRQGCCGALMVHAGREPPALDRARRLIDRFEQHDLDAVLVNAAGCGSTLKEYGHLLRDDPRYAERAATFAARVRDVSEFLADLPPAAPRREIRARAVYHDACHLAHAQGVRAEPRAVLATIPGLDLHDAPEWELCCGSAGVYNLLQPDAAAELGRRKAAAVARAGPQVVVTANPGCALQISRFLPVPTPMVHPVQLLDAAINGTALSV